MSFNTPEPGAVLNFGQPTVPRPAATVMLVRPGAGSPEVLLVKRGARARVAADAWVFPGGSVDPADGDGPAGLLAAARRELREETGIALAGEHPLLPLARWITPSQVKYRFDTWFFVGAAPARTTVSVDGGEIVDQRWLAPIDALQASAAGELHLLFPTIKQLQHLARFPTVDALLAHAEQAEVVAIEPRVVIDGNEARILLPGEPGYDDPPATALRGSPRR